MTTPRKPKRGQCPACFTFIGQFKTPMEAIDAMTDHIGTCLPTRRIHRLMREERKP